MSGSENFNFDNMEIAINSINDISKNIEEVFNSIYRIQEDFKKYHGGTYFETQFMTKSSMDSYVNEIDANKKWLKDYYDKLKDVETTIGNKSASLGDHVSTSSNPDYSMNKNNSSATMSAPINVNINQTNNFDNSSKINQSKQTGQSDKKNESDIKPRKTPNILGNNKEVEIQNNINKETDDSSYSDIFSSVSEDINQSNQGDYIDEGSLTYDEYITKNRIRSTETKNLSDKSKWTTRESLKNKDNSRATAENILTSAKLYQEKIHNDGNWQWTNGGLKYNDINSSAEHPKHYTECASYVASILYNAGIFSEDEINYKGVGEANGDTGGVTTGWQYNAPHGISELCEWSGWSKITNKNELLPGDIIFYKNSNGQLSHVDIYAGNGDYYNGGSTNALRLDGTQHKGAVPNSFVYAFRAPNTSSSISS